MLDALVSAQIPRLNIIRFVGFLGQEYMNLKAFMNPKVTASQWEKKRNLVPHLDEFEIVNLEVYHMSEKACEVRRRKARMPSMFEGQTIVRLCYFHYNGAQRKNHYPIDSREAGKNLEREVSNYYFHARGTMRAMAYLA
ncbi:hypothetical protein CJF30_00003480 [Rutstroemia sp. NJR-2017a BBW]|nr:hypothetical protein CJF30_00003480 [Rutstroemia sp. NJR-2017a BBW]